MEAGARGCLIVISGKLTGERHRTEKFKDGYIKYCGEPRELFVDTGFAVAKLKPGVIGVKVEIMHPEARLPAEIDVMDMDAALQANPDLADLLRKPEEASVIVEHPAEETSVKDEEVTD